MEGRNRATASKGAPAAEEWQVHKSTSEVRLRDLARRRGVSSDVDIMRSSQLDAGRLDSELSAMLQEQMMKAFAIFQPRYLNALRPEFTLLLDFLIYRFSIWKGRPTPGLALMNLRYRNEGGMSADIGKEKLGGRTGVEGPGLSTFQRVSWGLAFVLGKYLWTRLETVAAAYYWADQPEDSREHRAWKILQKAESAFRLLSLTNLVVFLRCGRYRSIVERLLRSRLVYRRANQPRALSFEYLNRQLVWHELSELILFLLPLINVERLKKLALRMFRGVQSPGLSAGTNSGQGDSVHCCQVCHRKDMLQPYTALPCKHMFCYFCLRSRTEHEPGYKCPTCDSVVTAMQRWTPLKT